VVDQAFALLTVSCLLRNLKSNAIIQKRIEGDSIIWSRQLRLDISDEVAPNPHTVSRNRLGLRSFGGFSTKGLFDKVNGSCGLVATVDRL
jgi:hypothetical protein